MAKLGDIEIRIEVDSESVRQLRSRVLEYATEERDRRLREIAGNEFHLSELRQVIDRLNRDSMIANRDMMGAKGFDYFHKGFSQFVDVEDDFRKQATMMTCRHCGNIVHTITHIDKQEKSLELIREEVLNAIGYHRDEDCFPPVEPPAHLSEAVAAVSQTAHIRYDGEKFRQVSKMRGRDLPINVFDFPTDIQVYFDTTRNGFRARCSLCRAHVCTVREASIESTLSAKRTSVVVDLLIATIKNKFSEHQKSCKALRRQGLRQIRVNVRRKSERKTSKKET